MKPTFFKGIVLGATVAATLLVPTAVIAGSGIGGIFNLGQSNRGTADGRYARGGEGLTPVQDG